MEQIEEQVAQKSALIYLPVSLGSALLFPFITTLIGSYPLVARIGGTVWVALLSLIASMPIVVSRVKKSSQNREGQYGRTVRFARDEELF